MPELTRRHWRTAIETHLTATDPGRARWLHQHPFRSEILNQLTSEVIDVWIDADQHRTAATSTSGSEWTAADPAADPAEIETIVVTRTLETPELWADLDDTYPHPTPHSTSTPAVLRLIPGSARPVNS